MSFTLRFLKDLPFYNEVQPYKIYGHPELSPEVESNLEFEDAENVVAKNIRQCQHLCCFADEGFEVVTSPSSCPLRAGIFEQRTPESDEIITTYLEEMMDMVKRRLKATTVFRRNDAAALSQELPPGDIRKQAIPVATIVHCDFSFDGGHERIRMHLTDDETESVESGRSKPMIVNVWRPLSTVTNAPLVMSDRRSIWQQDIIEADQGMADKVTKTAFLFHRPDQKWYWLPNQQPDEVFMFATWTPPTGDKRAGQVNFAEQSEMTFTDYCLDYSPHAAAFLHQTEGDVTPRESVEVRMIVLQDTMLLE
ncbi:hypothetical protein PVAG01_10620 [Phlyctema vagabunda]|uniref:Uncharacterized protein n=1 Tax=Phlyctema vagabunda TaxID=108571 RepID=A0ABR4P2T0_9HELO